MEQETRQRKPYQGVQCRLIDYSEETVMFTYSDNDENAGVTATTIAAYESALRMKANGDANGGPNYRPNSYYTYNPAYYFDPLLGLSANTPQHRKTSIPGCEGRYGNLPIAMFMLDKGLGWSSAGKFSRGEGVRLSSLKEFAYDIGCRPRGSSGGYGYGYSYVNQCAYCC